MPRVLAASLFAASVLCLADLLVRHHGSARPGGAMRGAAATAARLATLFIFLTPRQVAATAALLAAGTALALLAAGLPPGAAVLAGLLALLGRARLVSALAARRTRRLAAQLPDALAGLAAGLRAGRALPQALAAVAAAAPDPLGQELTLAVRQAGVGRPLEVGLEGLLQRCPSEDVRLAVVALDLGRRLGGDLADLLDRVAETIRERQRLEARMAVLTAQGRAQGLVLALLPPALAAVIHAIDPEYLLPLVTTAAGRATLAATVALQLAGFVAVRRIVAAER